MRKVLLLSLVLALIFLLLLNVGKTLPKRANKKTQTLFGKLSTTDGLRLFLWSGPQVAYSLEESVKGLKSGFMVMDVCREREWIPLDKGKFETIKGGFRYRDTSNNLSLGLEVTWRCNGPYISAEGKIWDTSSEDRAIVLRFQIPFGGNSVIWWKGLREWEEVIENERYDNTQLLVDNLVKEPIRTRFSRYPMSAVVAGDKGISFAVPLDEPRIFRLGYEDGFCFVEFDFGLTQKAMKYPSQATFSFIIYKIDPDWGFRDAVSRYYQFYPHLFERRVDRGGIIMPTGRIDKIQNPEDFHILAHWEFPVYDKSYYQYNNRNGYLNLHYALPGTSYTVRVDREDKEHQNAEYATQVVEERMKEALQDPEAPKNILFLASVRSMIKDRDGSWPFYPHYPVYAHGGMVCPCNPDPDLFSDKGYRCPNLAYYHIFVRRTFPKRSKTFVTLIREGEEEGFRIDGVGIDCMAWHTLEVYNHNEEHFPYADYPLTFHAKKPAIYNGISGYEYLKFVAEMMRGEGRFVAANLVNRVHNPWYAPLIDIPITEISKIPQPDSICCYKRTLYYQKPFGLLLLAHGSSFEDLTEEELLTYFHQSTFWGFYPSFHDAQGEYGEPIEYYWLKPSLYNRDRPLFKKFLPIIEELNEAGWEPVTYARTSNQNVFVERYGNTNRGLYFTVWNDGDSPTTFSLEIDCEKLDLSKVKVYELISGEEVPCSIQKGKISLEYHLDSHRTAVFHVMDLCAKCEPRTASQFSYMD